MRSFRLLALTVAFVLPTAINAQSLLEEIDTTAKQIAEVVKSKGGSIALDEIKDVTVGGQSNSGPGMLDMLGSALKRHEVKIDPKANLLLQGNYTVKVDQGLLKLRMELRILERSGEELVTLPRRYEGLIAQNADIAILFGLTVPLPPAGNPKDRNKPIEDALDPKGKKNPPPVKGSVVRTKEDSPYGLELRVKPNVKAEAKPRDVKLVDGKPFIDIAIGELYEIVLHNDTKHEAAVRIFIDGLDIFTFSEDRKADGTPQFGHFILSPGVTTIKGWHRTNKPLKDGNIWSFLVTEYGKGSDSARKSSGKVGVVTVTFGVSYPNDDERKKAEGAARDTRKETDRGPLDHQGFKAVTRSIGIERDVISIRYSK